MQRLTLGILAHVDAGKTTLSEAMLYRSGTIRKPGRVDNKDAFLDNYEVERARGITVFSKQAVIDYRSSDHIAGYSWTRGFFGGDGENTAGSGCGGTRDKRSGRRSGAHQDIVAAP